MSDKFLHRLLISILIIPLCLFPNLSAQSQSNERRVEEDKRKDLQATEKSIDSSMEIKPFSRPKPMDPLDKIYFLELIMKKVTYHYDLCKIIPLLLEQGNKYITLDSQIKLLKKNHFLPRRLEKGFTPEAPLRKGVAAYVFSKVLGIKGGWNIRLFGQTEHNAINELVYEGIMPAGNSREILSGEDLVLMYTQAINYRKNHAQ